MIPVVLCISAVWLTSCCLVVTWNAETFSLPSTCLSVVLNLEVHTHKKKTEPGSEKICVLLSRFFWDGRWSVQIPSVSQLQPQSAPLPVRHASAWWCCVLPVACWSKYSSLLAYLQCILFCMWVVVIPVPWYSNSIRKNWMQVFSGQSNDWRSSKCSKWYSVCAVAAFSASYLAFGVRPAAVWLGAFIRGAVLCVYVRSSLHLNVEAFRGLHCVCVRVCETACARLGLNALEFGKWCSLGCHRLHDKNKLGWFSKWGLWSSMGS